MKKHELVSHLTHMPVASLIGFMEWNEHGTQDDADWTFAQVMEYITSNFESTDEFFPVYATYTEQKA